MVSYVGAEQSAPGPFQPVTPTPHSSPPQFGVCSGVIFTEKESTMQNVMLESLSIVNYSHQPVITTELLAKLYGTTSHSITKNHRSNVGRFIDGKHYHKVVGQDLAVLRVTFSDLQISSKTRSLILWTERGAARHAKMLETDQAWEVFERLEDCYFNQRHTSELPATQTANQLTRLTEPAYRREARDYLEGVLHDCTSFAEQNGMNTRTWPLMDYGIGVDGVLACLLERTRYELSFDNSMEMRLKPLPAGGQYLMTNNAECMRQLVRHVVSDEVLRVMMKEGLKRIGLTD